jgi:hypothetical protein
MDLGNFIISIFSTGFGALAAFYFSAYQARNDSKNKCMSSLHKAEYILNKYSANNKIIKEYIDLFLSDESIEYVCDWERIKILDNKFPILEIDIQTLLFLVDYNQKCGIYVLEKFDKKICEYTDFIKHSLAYIFTLDEKVYFYEKKKSRYYEFILSKEMFYRLLNELHIPTLDNFKVPSCIVDKISHEQQQIIIFNTGYTFNILDKILLAISENAEMMRILGERNQKYSMYLERIEKGNYKSIRELKSLINPRLYDELKLLTQRMLEVNKNTIYDCENAASVIAEFLEVY